MECGGRWTRAWAHRGVSCSFIGEKGKANWIVRDQGIKSKEIDLEIVDEVMTAYLLELHLLTPKPYNVRRGGKKTLYCRSHCNVSPSACVLSDKAVITPSSNG